MPSMAKNPVIYADYSDPDVIRVGDDFYMISSSFNYVPGVPVLHSKNLVEWELVNYVFDSIPFEGYEVVRHGCGAWAPSIRYHGGKFYALIPFPDEGIYVAETEDIRGRWSPLRPLLKGKGFEDPCPIWEGDKCYVVFAFAKSRAGFNSVLAVFETDVALTVPADRYNFIFDGVDIAPKIEGPKWHKRGEYFYILAPAGGVGSGWQVALRSKDIYGPYEMKIVLAQGDTPVNGPHQGALIDLDDGGQRWAFMHFQQVGAYGRIVHLQPAVWRDDWPVLGDSTAAEVLGSPVAACEYPVDVVTGMRLPAGDEFSGGLSPAWQTPAAPVDGAYVVGNDGLRANCLHYGEQPLSDLPWLLTQRTPYKNFDLETEFTPSFENEGDEAGFCLFGRQYTYVCAVRREGGTCVELRLGGIGKGEDKILASLPAPQGPVRVRLAVRYRQFNKMCCRISVDGMPIVRTFFAEPGVWVGARLAVYARSSAPNGGSALFKYVRIAEV